MVHPRVPGLGLLAVACAPGVAAAQIRPPQTPQEQIRDEMLKEDAKRRMEADRNLERYTFPFSTLPKDAPLPFQLGYRPQLQQLFPRYEGLPTWPDNVPGYGDYPGTAPRTPDGAEVPRSLPSLEHATRDKDRWPSWVRAGVAEEDSRLRVDRAVLVRATDRVWFLDPGEPAFVPLAHYDRFRFLTVGSRVEVGGKGEFQVAFHDGAGMRSRGPCALAVVGMDEAELVLQLTVADNVWLQALRRPMRVTLPDGTVVDFADTLLHIERKGDRYRVANEGDNPVKFAGQAGTGALDGPRFIVIWAAPPERPPIGDELRVLGDAKAADGAQVTTVRGGADGRVEWKGARFTVGEGATLELEPLKPLDLKPIE